MTIFVIMFCASGLLLAGLAVPLILGKIPPNGLYGFRVKKTMENPEIWYPVNTYSGKWLLAAGLAEAAAALLISLIPGLTLDLYAYLMLGVLAIFFGTAIIASVSYLKKM
jgi:hypothetical protein